MPHNFHQLMSHAENMMNTGELHAADATCRYILHKNPGCVEALFTLGNIFFSRSIWQEAAEHYRSALFVDPNNAVILNNYGLALLETARNYNRDNHELFNEAIAAFERALEFRPDYFSALLNLGLINKESGNLESAIQYYRKAANIEPCNSDLWMQMGTLNAALYHFDKAIDCYLHLLKSNPKDPAEIYCRIATLYSYLGEIDKAVGFFNNSIETASITEQKRHYESNRLFTLHYLPQITPSGLAVEHRLWGNKYFYPKDTPVFLNTPEAKRKLRIGYVSGDFRMNAVFFFIQPVLAAHDPAKFEIYCYSNVEKKDIVTNQLIQKHRIVWQEIAGVEDNEACSLIRADKIDILVDLSGHSGQHRLPLFALRPAPIQITWIGYPDTTGLPSMDYRFTDEKADPPGHTEHLHTEELVRLPRTFLCYNPGRDFPSEGVPPFALNGFISFGTMSNFSKINDSTVEMWCKIMSKVPESRLVLRYRGQEWGRIHNQLSGKLELRGIPGTRLVLLGHATSIIEQIKAYQQIDIALDTYPYHGTTTTCEALYMGVPVITLAGRSHLSRVGVSLLETVGLKDFIANSEEEYIEKAVALAYNPQLIAVLRQNLRKIMLNSALCDNVTFTANLEEIYRSIWLRWCNSAQP
jgi:predicted O-linked N-acetylglucosamine transferase (SPINDLY family)